MRKKRAKASAGRSRGRRLAPGGRGDRLERPGRIPSETRAPGEGPRDAGMQDHPTRSARR